MAIPIPFGRSTLDNAPLKDDGSDFPCKQRTGVYNPEGASNIMPLGSTQPLNFIGSAVHGGGSCQISITYDAAPTKDSTWKVIHSIEGGCPMQNVGGNYGDNANQPVPDTYHFTIPTGLPTGTAVLAWTWFNKIGNREMYMNCAPIEITGNTKRTERNVDGELVEQDSAMIMERSQATYNALPDMFVANVDKDGCHTTEGIDVRFYQPGGSLELLGQATPSARQFPTGVCEALNGGSGRPVDVPAPTQPPVANNPVLPGDVSISIAPDQNAINVPVVTSAPVATVPVATTLATTTAAAPTPTSVSTGPFSPPSGSSGSGASSGNGASVPNINGPVTGGSAIAANTACPDQEGSWNCIDGNSFQRCASGQWTVVQSVAAGTKCESGISQNIKITSAKSRRTIRFSNEHVHRHRMHSS